MKRSYLLLGLVLAGCSTQSKSGAIRGRVLSSNGSPVAGARVMLDHTSGRVTLSNAHGEFRLSGAKDGTHRVFALANGQAATAVTSVSGVADVGDLTLEDCTTIVAQGGTTVSGGSAGGGTGANGGAPAPTATPGATGSTGSNDPGSVDPNGTIPCEVDPPPPPPPHVDFAALHADYADGYVDGTGISGWGWDDTQSVGFDFYLPGNFLSGGSASAHVDGSTPTDPTTPTGYMSLYTADGYIYLLASGDLSVAVAAPTSSPVPTATPVVDPPSGGAPQPASSPTTGDPTVICNGPMVPAGGAPNACPGDETVAHFDFHGENLSFDYLDWDGNVDATHTASAPSADASGDAYVYVPPPPPTADVTIANFTADWTSLFLCQGCNTDGTDLLSVYAYDSVDQADLSLSFPVSDLALPGSATLTGTPWNGGPVSAFSVFGNADYYGGGAYWSYTLDSIGISTDATALASGQAVVFTVANGSFDYMDSNGAPVPLMTSDASSGSTTLHLFITAGTLSGTIDADCGVTPDGTAPNGGGVAGPVAVALH
ncbi:MAG TPA: carboxypeptidase-like regulatory domain-containing protein [bacterium]|nr:carboxypeptidase-like regulatory domain-containing protein [bacterium]